MELHKGPWGAAVGGDHPTPRPTISEGTQDRLAVVIVNAELALLMAGEGPARERIERVVAAAWELHSLLVADPAAA